MRRFATALLTAVIATMLTSCVQVKRPALQPTAAVPGATLWQQPSDLSGRDLFYGPWGREHAPDPKATYTLVKMKRSGVNPGMTVRDPQGREWSVKQEIPGGVDSEVPVEVTFSRILSAIGYHQPPVYFLPSFTLKDDWGTHQEPAGRFRLDHESVKEADPWSWQENPFIGSKPYQGLLVLMMMFNATDLKNSNNSIYEVRLGDRVEQWYAVRDVGAALGDTLRFAPRKGNIGAFEGHPFILGVTNGRVDFAYKGWYDKLVKERITPDNVAWVSSLLAQLTERQWHDAFRAGGHAPEIADRFIRKLREKVAEGRKIGTRTADE